MKENIAIRSFSSQDEARDVALKLEIEGIPCRVTTEVGGICTTLFVNPDHFDVAARIIGDDGFDLAPLSEEPNESTAETEHNSNTKDLLAQVSGELDAIAEKEKTPWQNLGVLAVSLILFMSLGLFRASISSVALLLGVIFVHECGHFIGMKLLRYKDIKMFFIPLFGAAVSGTETAPSDLKKAVVSLLGPVPGIIIGVATGIAYLRTGQPLLADATRIFLFLNTFNLLPLHPLDGGRFFDAVLFSRHPKLEIGFKIITALVLGWLAVVFKDIFFGVFAFVSLLSLHSTRISAYVARAVGKQLSECENTSSCTVPSQCLPLMVTLLRDKLPSEQVKPKLIARYVTEIWQRVRNKRCSTGSAIGLLLCYGFFILLGISSAFIFEAAAVIKGSSTEVVLRTLPTGDTTRIQMTSIRGQKVSETQINDDGLFHGTQTAWSLGTTNKSKEGHWKDGYWHGQWKFWDAKGELIEMMEYDMGNPVRYQKLINGEMQDIPRNEWPRLRQVKQNKPRGINENK
jgi:Zn-dependent protease